MIQGAVRLAPSQLLVSWIPLSNISRMTRFPLTCCPLMIKFVGHRNRNRALQSTWVRTSGSRNQRTDSRTERVLRLGITPIQKESQLSEHRELYPHVSARRWEAIRVSGYRAHGVVIWQIDVVNIADDEAKKLELAGVQDGNTDLKAEYVASVVPITSRRSQTSMIRYLYGQDELATGFQEGSILTIHL